MKIRVSDDAGLAELLDYAAYQKQCEEEAAREIDDVLKDRG